MKIGPTIPDAEDDTAKLIADRLKEIDWPGLGTLIERTLNLVAENKIDTYACTIAGMPAWYSVGLMFFGRPELIVCCQDPELGQHVLGHFIQQGTELGDGQGISLTEHVAVAPKMMTTERARQNLTMAHLIHGMTLQREVSGDEGDYLRLPEVSKPCLLASQLVFSDEEGRFPWHPGFRTQIEQPKLWRDAASEKTLS